MSDAPFHAQRACPPPWALRATANLLAIAGFTRLLLVLPTCCGSWSHPALAVAILGAALTAGCLRLGTIKFLLEVVSRTDSFISRVRVTGLGVAAGVIGAEALWAIPAYVPRSGPFLHAVAVLWAACCAAMIWRHWRRSPSDHDSRP